MLVSAALFKLSYGSSILDSQHCVYYFSFCILCIIDSVLLIALLYLAYHLVQRCNNGVGDTNRVFLQEHVNEISISPLWQWCPKVTPQATSCDWQVGERYKYNLPQCCPDGRKNKQCGQGAGEEFLVSRSRILRRAADTRCQLAETSFLSIPSWST